MTSTDQIELFAEKVKQISHQIGVLEDIQAIRTLHFKYGYYMDMNLASQIRVGAPGRAPTACLSKWPNL